MWETPRRSCSPGGPGRRGGHCGWPDRRMRPKEPLGSWGSCSWWGSWGSGGQAEARGLPAGPSPAGCAAPTCAERTVTSDGAHARLSDRGLRRPPKPSLC